MPVADPVLESERAHLAHARAALAAMRARTLSLEVQAPDPVNAEVLARALHYRALALADDPHTTLFFGRIDLDPATAEPGLPASLHVGRRHVADEAGDPVVIDWRAQVSTAFYRASHTDPMGVTLRRRFGVDHGEITAVEDEHLTDVAEPQAHSGILAQEIERPRSGPMRDIVATIQPDQDVLVRADAGTTVCVQGAPGTGKTAVGLHRAAYLLHGHRERLSRSGVLVIGPNRAFLDHVGAVLPTLGEVQVGHTTIDGLVSDTPARGLDSVATATLKGDARMAEVLRRAVWSHVVDPTQPLVVPRGIRRWRVPAYEVHDIVEELRSRGVRYDAARQMLPHRLAHAVLVLMHHHGDGAVQWHSLGFSRRETGDRGEQHLLFLRHVVGHFLDHSLINFVHLHQRRSVTAVDLRHPGRHRHQARHLILLILMVGIHDVGHQFGRREICRI